MVKVNNKLLFNNTVYKVILHYNGEHKTIYLPIIPRVGDFIHNPFIVMKL